MGETLSKALQRYYTRKGNRILFSNGMTLNQLAWEMWERLGYEGIDPSVLSRVLKRERLFTFKQLEVFGQILHLGQKEENRLKTILLNEISLRFGFDEDYLSLGDKVFIELVEENLEKVRELKTKDLPNITDDWIDNLLEKLRERIYLTLNSTRKKALMRLYAEFLIEKMYCLQVTRPKRKGLKTILMVSKRLEKIGQELDNTNYISVANIHAGDIYYINQLYSDAVKYLSKGVSLYRRNTQKIFAWTPLRPLALSFAYLKNQGEFDKIRARIVKDLPGLRIDAQCLALEGLTKGEAILGRARESERFLVKAHKIHQELRRYGGPYEQLMKVLLTVGELRSVEQLGSKRNAGYIEKLGNEGMKLAREHGYKRHEIEIKGLLDQVLN